MKLSHLILGLVGLLGGACTQTSNPDPGGLYRLRDLENRAVSAENLTGAKGGGGTAGNGVKGNPCIVDLKSGQSVSFFEAEGPGMIRHIWCTVGPHTAREVRNVILRMYWEGSEVPSVEVPLSDFFGLAHGATRPFCSALISVQPVLGYNCDIPMPFARSARFTVTNDSETDLDFFFYHVDYTLGDRVTDRDGRFHACFRRENPTRYGQDYTILQTEGAQGVFIGCMLGVRSLSDGWWGEGEMKIYLDGDREYPTICGTGTEDYFCGAWGMVQHADLYRGAPLVDGRFNSMYRFHVTDPIYFKNDIRVTIQQMGLDHIDVARARYGDSLIYRHDFHPRRDPERAFYRRIDDVCSVAYWYQYPLIHSREPLPDRAARSRNLYGEPESEMPAPM